MESNKKDSPIQGREYGYLVVSNALLFATLRDARRQQGKLTFSQLELYLALSAADDGHHIENHGAKQFLQPSQLITSYRRLVHVSGLSMRVLCKNADSFKAYTEARGYIWNSERVPERYRDWPDSTVDLAQPPENKGRNSKTDQSGTAKQGGGPGQKRRTATVITVPKQVLNRLAKPSQLYGGTYVAPAKAEQQNNEKRNDSLKHASTCAAPRPKRVGEAKQKEHIESDTARKSASADARTFRPCRSPNYDPSTGGSHLDDSDGWQPLRVVVATH